jgi:hypothetical protein
MKSFHEPIDVTIGDDGLPRRLRWRRHAWRVLRVLDRWVLQTRWWSRQERRDYLLLQATAYDEAELDSCVLEVYLRRLGSSRSQDVWILARIVG